MYWIVRFAYFFSVTKSMIFINFFKELLSQWVYNFCSSPIEDWSDDNDKPRSLAHTQCTSLRINSLWKSSLHYLSYTSSNQPCHVHRSIIIHNLKFWKFLLSSNISIISHIDCRICFQMDLFLQSRDKWFF